MDSEVDTALLKNCRVNEENDFVCDVAEHDVKFVEGEVYPEDYVMNSEV